MEMIQQLRRKFKVEPLGHARGIQAKARVVLRGRGIDSLGIVTAEGIRAH